MRAPLRTKGHLAHPRHDGVECQLRSVWLKILGLSPAQPRNHRDTPEPAEQCAPCGIKDLPTLGSHSQKPTHRQHAYNNHL